jgi:hypothetical protein
VNFKELEIGRLKLLNRLESLPDEAAGWTILCFATLRRVSAEGAHKKVVSLVGPLRPCIGIQARDCVAEEALV